MGLDILDFGGWAETKTQVSELGSWAGTKAQQFWKIKDGTTQDQAHWHNLDALVLVSGAHGPAQRQINFGR